MITQRFRLGSISLALIIFLVSTELPAQEQIARPPMLNKPPMSGGDSAPNRGLGFSQKQENVQARRHLGQKSVTCSGSVKPDRAVIVGFLSHAGDKPTAITQELDKAVEALKSLLAEFKSEVIAHGVVRGLKGNQIGIFGSTGTTGASEPYVFKRPIEIVLNDFSKVDNIIEKLPKNFTLGDDQQFGQGSKIFVLYRMEDPLGQIKTLTQKCFSDHLIKECPDETCKNNWKLSGYNLMSGQVPGAKGYDTVLNFSEGLGFGGLNRDQDLASSESINLSGNIMVVNANESNNLH